MKTMHFSTVIQAGRPTVWHAMLGPDSYRRWTAPFAEGSYYDGSWDQGATIRFLAPADDYERRASYARVLATLASGKQAWVYVHSAAPQAAP